MGSWPKEEKGPPSLRSSCCVVQFTSSLFVVVYVCTAAIDQVVDCLDEIDCLTQPVPVDNSLVHRLLNDNRLLSVLEVSQLCFVHFLQCVSLDNITYIDVLISYNMYLVRHESMNWRHGKALDKCDAVNQGGMICCRKNLRVTGTFEILKRWRSFNR